MMKNHHYHSSSSSCCKSSTATTDTHVSSSTTSCLVKQEDDVFASSTQTTKTEHHHYHHQKSHSQPISLSSVSISLFSWKRRYLFCWIMAISLLAIDLIRKNNVLHVIQKISKGTVSSSSSFMKNGNNKQVEAPTVLPPRTRTRLQMMEKNDTMTTTTHSAIVAAFPWRNVMEFTLNATEELLRRHEEHDTPWHNVNKDKTLPLCEREEIRNGHWVPTLLKDGAPYITNTVHLRCHSKEYYQQIPFPTYKWSVAVSNSRSSSSSNNDNVDNAHDSGDSSQHSTGGGCDLTPWRWQLSCKILAHATVLIVGDSLSWEQYSSLVQLHPNGSIRQGYQHQSRYLQQNIIQTVCQNNNNGQPGTGPTGSLRLVYRRDDHLDFLQQAIQDDFPTVLILNRGAHYVNDTLHVEKLRYETLPIVQEWLNQCHYVYNIKCHFFWRTSVPGHPGCAAVNVTVNTVDNSTTTTASSSSSPIIYTPRYTSPNNNRQEMETLVNNMSNYNDYTMTYHWYDYQRQNQLVLAELESWATRTTTTAHSSSNDNKNVPFHYRIIDAYDLNILRPDEHRAHDGDCLHNCYPGKMDVYNQLLLHYLRIDRTIIDVIQLQNVAHSLPKSGSSTRSSNGGTTKSIVVVETSNTPYNRTAWEMAMTKARKNKQRPKNINNNDNQTVVPAVVARQDDQHHGHDQKGEMDDDNDDIDETKPKNNNHKVMHDTATTTSTVLILQQQMRR